MSATTMEVHLPRLPSPDVFKNPAISILTVCGQALLTYDPATRCGFIYHLVPRTWLIAAPIDFATFANYAAGSGYRIAEGGDADRWLAACDPRPADIGGGEFVGQARH